MGTKTKTEVVPFCDKCKKDLTTYDHVRVTKVEEQESGHNGDLYDSTESLGDFCTDCWNKMSKGVR